jgi:threonine synthase
MRVFCTGCGATVDPRVTLPFACPAARPDDDIDHVLNRELGPTPLVTEDHLNPFRRYRRRLLAWHLTGDDDAYLEMIEGLDRALIAVDGRGFRITPCLQHPQLAAALGIGGALWLKDETGNVSGSHKGRHLMAVLLALLALERLPAFTGLRRRRLAIASCGNAALAAAVLARAADWPLDVCIPTDAEPTVVARLRDLGATIRVCRRDGTPGDPCVTAYRRLVADGALPFSVQGNDNGVAIEGGRTIGWELAEQLPGAPAQALFIQVGGGALASGTVQGLAETGRPLPRLYTVQTMGARPLQRAYDRFQSQFADADLDGALCLAAMHRSAFMWPWESIPHSIAHGILDDETYDWRDLVGHLRRTGGAPLTADEDALKSVNDLVRVLAGIDASHTGTAGLAGVTALENPPMSAIALITGAAR